MTRSLIPVENLLVRHRQLWGKQGLLLTSGDLASGRFNTMTIGWGSLGVMWSLPFVQVAVRPQRYTYEFIEQYPTFTVCAFDERYYDALQLLGAKSGRDGDKIAEAGLTPLPSTRVAAPGFAEAGLVLECRKIYWADLHPDHFLDDRIERRYPNRDYHRLYFGEILAVLAEASFQV